MFYKMFLQHIFIITLSTKTLFGQSLFVITKMRRNAKSYHQNHLLENGDASSAKRPHAAVKTINGVRN